MNIGGREYPVTGYVESDGIGAVPIVGIRMMSDEEWHRSCLESRKKHPEVYREMGEDVEAVIAMLEQLLEGVEA